MSKKFDKDEKALRTCDSLSIVLSFSTKKAAKRVFRRLESERVEAKKSERKADRIGAKNAKVVLDGKKVSIIGQHRFAKYFAEEIIGEPLPEGIGKTYGN